MLVKALVLLLSLFSVTALIEIDGQNVDAYLVDDVESSVIDFSSKSSECSNQASGNGYAKLLTDGSLACALCGREDFMESYNADTRDNGVEGTRHAPCCQNSHHRVCRKMLEEFKLRCEYEDKVAKDLADFDGSWYGKGVDHDDSACSIRL